MKYGRYEITMTGSLSDIWDDTYHFEGIFEVIAAQTLDLETAAYRLPRSRWATLCRRA